MLVLIDNYDSFTYNLVHYFEEIGEKVQVFRNDEITTEKVFKLNPKYIVISPGPSVPKNSGICMELVKINSQKKIYHTNIRSMFGSSSYCRMFQFFCYPKWGTNSWQSQ